MLSESAPLI